ncbi:MAG: hypothetical protein ACXV3V_00930 [Actinomycetes bacterium]
MALLTLLGTSLYGVSGAGATEQPSTTTESATANCTDVVQVTLGGVQVVGREVVISFTHNDQDCPGATPARLHVHANLVSGKHAGSDPVNQLNRDFQISGSSGNSVTIPLLDGVPGKCWVQVDRHVSGQRKGSFVPAATCPAEETKTPTPVVTTPAPVVTTPVPVVTTETPAVVPTKTQSTPTKTPTKKPATVTPTPTPTKPVVKGVKVGPKAPAKSVPKAELPAKLPHTGPVNAPVAAIGLGLFLAGVLLRFAGRRPARR